MRYDDSGKRGINEPVNITQEFRYFDFSGPWEQVENLTFLVLGSKFKKDNLPEKYFSCWARRHRAVLRGGRPAGGAVRHRGEHPGRRAAAGAGDHRRGRRRATGRSGRRLQVSITACQNML